VRTTLNIALKIKDKKCRGSPKKYKIFDMIDFDRSNNKRFFVLNGNDTID